MSVYSTEAYIKLKDMIETPGGWREPTTLKLFAQRPVGTNWYMFEIEGYVRFLLEDEGLASIIVSERAFWTLAFALLGLRLPYELRRDVEYLKIDKKNYFSPEFTLNKIRELLSDENMSYLLGNEE